MIDDDILNLVERPGRYIGNEINMIKKDHKKVDIRVVVAFPDTYEVGMSHLGMKIIYGILNNLTYVACERAFAPWIDMEEVMRRQSIPLSSIETQTALRDFDIVGFSLQSELNYTNVLNMLDLGGIPLMAEDRSEKDPLVIAGGPCCFNPEPMADFIDLFVIGEAEDVILEIVNLLRLKVKSSKLKVKRPELLREMARIEGVYVPSLYEVTYKADGTIEYLEPKLPGIARKIRKRVIFDLDRAFYPTRPPIPFIQTVHDRMNLEIMRGCGRGCRFCQSRAIYHPKRERSLSRLLELAKETFYNTGYEDISLLSLSSGDYSRIEELLVRLNEAFDGKGVAISLPSLRVERSLWELPSIIAKVRRTGLTFAPEAGTDRLRGVINKRLDMEGLVECILRAYRAAWRKVKLYFMIGLPTETQEDLEGICRLVHRIANIDGKQHRSQGPWKETVSISPFIPKPHTSFQWEPMMDLVKLKERGRYLRERLIKMDNVKCDLHPPNLSYLEAALSRGDRRLSYVIFRAWEKGAKFDGWTESFRFDRWMEAFCEVDLDPEFYVTRRRSFDENLPWDHIDVGIQIHPFPAS